MKRLILIFSLTISMIAVYSQAVLEHVYPQLSVQLPVKLSNNEWVYPVTHLGLPITDVEIYSSSHVLFKTIPLYIPSGYMYFNSVYISDVLFNSDSKIEVLYNVQISWNLQNTYLINEDGMVLQEFPHQYIVCIFNMDGAYKLITGSEGGGDTCRIYSLPGTMADIPAPESQLTSSASPNPCKDLIEISHPINAVRIRIISVEGKEVYRVNTRMALSTKIQTMALPAGTYIYEVTLSDQRKLTGKFIKR
ncbi:MAG: T9SS type A sorting domain-containing protein [Bacteroidetes bacterium]|nr:T9SS type A sorting domain-containing protein [Bacteroidota bacterium]